MRRPNRRNSEWSRQSQVEVLSARFDPPQLLAEVRARIDLEVPNPLAVANLDGGTVLRGGADAALYLASGRQIRITTIPSVFVVTRQFTTRAPEPGESVMRRGSSRLGQR